jgi:hypothetical protein
MPSSATKKLDVPVARLAEDDPDRTLLGRVLQRVAEQVLQHLGDANRIRYDRDRSIREARLEPLPLAAGRRLRGFDGRRD